MEEIPSVSATELVENRIPEEGKMFSLLAKKREGGLPESLDPNRTLGPKESSRSHWVFALQGVVSPSSRKNLRALSASQSVRPNTV